MNDLRLFLGLIAILAVGLCVNGQAGYRLAEEEDEIQRLIPPEGPHPKVDVTQYADGRHVEIMFVPDTVDSLAVLNGPPSSGVSTRDAKRIARMLERFYDEFGEVTEVKVGIDRWIGIGDVGFWWSRSILLDADDLQTLKN